MATDNLNDIITFVTVIDQKSFTQAAKQLGVTHSVISKRINRLEKNLNARLIQRTTRRITLTEIGQAFYGRCAQIKKDLEEATQAVTSSHTKPLGKLRVNAPMSFGQLHLIPATTQFIERYPDVDVEVILGRQYANLIEENLDLSIQVTEPEDSSFVARKLALRSTMVCASPQYFGKHGIPKHPHELVQYNCLTYKHREHYDDWRFIIDGQEQSLRVKGNFQVNSSQGLARAAVSGLGIARLPSYLISREIQMGDLIPVLNEFCPRNIGIYAVYPHQRYLAAKVQVFVEFLQERFSQEQYWNYL